MDIYEIIRTRKSVRAYDTTRDVSDETLTKLLEAARLAPSAKNLQEWRFIIVRDQEKRNALVDAAKGQTFIAQAPVILVCCAETDNRVMSCGQSCYPIDVAIAIDHITLAAVSEGLGTCWIGAFFENKVKELLDIPRHIRVVELLPIGYPINPAPDAKDRLPLPSLLHYEKWNQ